MTGLTGTILALRAVPSAVLSSAVSGPPIDRIGFQRASAIIDVARGVLVAGVSRSLYGR